MAIHYRPLDRSHNEIRLLKLLPQGGDDKYKLIPACQIFYASLLDEPQYVALSYVWGNEETKRVILVDDLQVRVRENLYDAMMALRTIHNNLIIWIDSLCIDQANYQEKSWQVELMKGIYRQATQVYAWLGRADRDSDRVMDYLNIFGAKAEACEINTMEGHHLRIWRCLASREATVDNTMQQNVMVVTDEGSLRIIRRRDLDRLFYSISGWHQQDDLLPVHGMQRLFTRPFWGRIWILQEITLPENVEFLCGTKRISRSRCSAAINAYAALWAILTEKCRNEALPVTRYHEAITTRLFHHRPNVMLSSWRIYRYSQFPLAALLRATCVGSNNLNRHGPHHFESTDPRDKIFALLSLASDREDLKRRGVFPDYSQSCVEIYTSAMAAFLQQGHMSLLSCCQPPKLRPGLPSWVPDWSRSITHMLQDVENDHITLYPTFRASGTDSYRRNITAKRVKGSIQGISVMGTVYDEIDVAGCFPGRTSSKEVPLLETWSWPEKWLVEILRLTYRKSQHFEDFRDRLRAAARSSIAGAGLDPHGRPARLEDDRFSDAVLLVKSGMQYIREENIKSDVRQFLSTKTTKEIARGRTLADIRLRSEIIGKSLGRLPFVSRKGHLVVSSEHVKQGDVIALIKGTQVPFILRRRTGGVYKLVSEAYVDGIMDGEVAEDVKFAPVELV
ncbi:uncharacterized protein Z519_06952 [Cladophialophora bantiana CBS 173.52]|uniref:Heterokaryon incompatibility domain-containing protein n=1 Tax=Cladophialophora bantiana (strain ATCC 10958 / CBS 173.52 / CDC B-1940 / NIH 8579) TaxID=1442370 RepID=A0A0D2HMG5_CLAB1|nr:uncharacterized protein Z519_06952 [Cladophialophora bantiana CBS 173.52]KIW91970.1 hypothetical protein Z519_06952 [Cladophialophora bantiana CBS 173.52]